MNFLTLHRQFSAYGHHFLYRVCAIFIIFSKWWICDCQIVENYCFFFKELLGIMSPGLFREILVCGSVFSWKNVVINNHISSLTSRNCEGRNGHKPIDNLKRKELCVQSLGVALLLSLAFVFSWHVNTTGQLIKLFLSTTFILTLFFLPLLLLDLDLIDLL